LARLTGWLFVLAVIALSIIPGDLRPHTPLPGYSEHFAMYLGGCALLAVGYERRIAGSVIALAFSLVAAGLEIAQMFVSDRHASPFDVFASAGGAFLGAGLAYIFLLLWRQYLH
jgi:VanZ family protein